MQIFGLVYDNITNPENVCSTLLHRSLNGEFDPEITS
jgi:hypothetical protein